MILHINVQNYRPGQLSVVKKSSKIAIIIQQKEFEIIAIKQIWDTEFYFGK